MQGGMKQLELERDKDLFFQTAVRRIGCRRTTLGIATILNQGRRVRPEMQE